MNGKLSKNTLCDESGIIIFTAQNRRIQRVGRVLAKRGKGCLSRYAANAAVLIMYFVYILQSLNSNRYYIGHTNHIDRRIQEHNTGNTKSTKAFAPWKLVYTEKFKSRLEAVRREREIKSYKSGYKFQELKNTESWQSG
jgi:putative endonuclease